MTRDPAGTEATIVPPPAPFPTPHGPPEPLRPADAGAEMAGKAAAENFPVALRMLPRRYRDHLMAVYAYARTVDDIGDEAPKEERPALLAGLEEDLRRLYDNEAEQPRDPSVRGLARVVTDCQIPVQPFRGLIEANKQDQVVSRYETFGDLLQYCTLSANPVGQIVLYVFSASTPERAALSDAICSGLQIVEHLQDVGEDFRAGRVYLPADDLRSYGVTDAELAASTASPQLRSLIAVEADRAGALMSQGAPLIGQLHGFAKVAVAGYLAGGRAALAAIRAADYDVLAATRKPTKGRTVRELVSILARGR